MSKAINLRLEDDDHRRLKVLAAESGLTFARVIGLALQALEEVLPPSKVEVEHESPTEADPRQRVLPGVTFTVQPLGLVEPAPEPDAPPVEREPETSPAGQPAPSTAADDDWWRDL